MTFAVRAQLNDTFVRFIVSLQVSHNRLTKGRKQTIHSRAFSDTPR
jgi:hypothetical protein